MKSLLKNNALRFHHYYILLAVVFLVVSCNPFSYSPYEVPQLKQSETNLNAKNIDAILKLKGEENQEITFAVLSDSHIEYSNLEDFVHDVNRDKDIRFVIHLGDLTDAGLSKEYIWTNEIMEELKVPYITVVGNHDYISNGGLVYKKMFGAPSFTFSYHNTKFVFFDDVFWENNNTIPDFNWLNANLSDSEKYKNVFVFSHIPPFGDQFDDASESSFIQMMNEHNVKCSFHGHVHTYYYGPYYPTSKAMYLTANYLKNREYYKVYVKDTTFTIQTIKF